MKIHIGIEGPVGKALNQVLFTVIAPNLSVCDNFENADIVIIDDERKLHKFYDEKKFFAIFSIKEKVNLPSNTRWIPALEFIPTTIEYLEFVEKELSERIDSFSMTVKTETGKEFSPSRVNSETKNILVIDDKTENRQLAIDLLGKNHYLTLAGGFAEGLQLVKENSYDVVLSDCQMRPEIENSALSIDAVDIGQTVHNGIFMIFHATKRGARVAIVTDANHHQDWVSAIFDDLHEPQEVNGQPVLLINYMRKNWDKALKALMSI